MRPLFLLLWIYASLVDGSWFGSSEDTKKDEPVAESSSGSTCANQNADGTCPSGLANETKFHPVCGLYMAPSSIPNAGWGMYTNQNLKNGQAIDPLDVSIPVVDFAEHTTNNNDLLVGYEDLPSWLMHEYYWNSDVIYAQFEARAIDGVLPGFGMLANSHVGLINTHNIGAQNRESRLRDDPSVGARSEYQDLTFNAIGDIPAGHELFAEYGDEWFEERTYAFGDALPLSYHFKDADGLLKRWNATFAGNVDSPMAKEVYSFVVEAFDGFFPKRFKTALPKTPEEAKEQLNGKGTAYATVPNIIRDQDWLEEHGMCLDHITPAESKHVPDERGAFATRKLPKGSLVAPAPLIHSSRKHFHMAMTDQNGEILWKGHQLLLNYCYGHKSSSLLFFPYSPTVNLINNGGKEKANVGLRWSEKQGKPEMMEWNTQKVLEFNRKSGLAMEFYALRDIEEGEEVLIDYGEDWQEAWDRHVFDWVPPVNSGGDYMTAWDYDIRQRTAIYTEPDYPPSRIDVRCWVNVDIPGEKSADGWYHWRPAPDTELDSSTSCVILGRSQLDDREVFDVKTLDQKDPMQFRGVPENMITYTDKSYTTNLHLRSAFRHEIELPSEMIPDSWRDIEVPPGKEKCGLYMAESSIPNAGLGMFTGQDLKEFQRVCDGDVAIQVEDYELNVKLRHWAQNVTDYDEPTWLMGNYYWDPATTQGSYEADNVESVVPGMGMLANSHTALHNSDLITATQTIKLHRGRDPGAGGSTHYHDVYFYAEHDLPAGHELFVGYGDEWFNDRDNLGPIPLSYHFTQADETLGTFMEIVRGDIESEVAKDLWEVLATASSKAERFNSAFPKNLTDVPRLAEEGTAKDSLPNRVRSLEWLEQNGLCLDNIRVDWSTIRQAGKGAFATRNLAKDTTVLPIPLVHLRRHSMEVFASDDYDDPTVEVRFEGLQQLLNYCFGHPDSSLLLYPYSPMSNYINHNATKANVYLKWSSLPNHLTSWLERTPDDLDSESHAGLIMEVVAARDIRPGEEIFLDYGQAWAKAWNTHIDSFSPGEVEKDYVSAAQLNNRLEWLRTLEELESGDHYDFNFEVVQTVCYLGKNYAGLQAGSVIRWEYIYNMYNDAGFSYPCQVLERHTFGDPRIVNDRRDSSGPPRVDLTYTVSVLGLAGEFKVTGIPRMAIFFRDARYQSDFAYRKGFRHEIHVREELYPPAWLDLK